MGREKRNKVLFSGYARLPDGTCGAEVIKIIGVVVVVDMDDDGRILDAECTLPTGVARKLVAEILIGQSLARDQEKLLAQLATVFQDSSLRALISAIRALYNRYASHIEVQQARLTIPVLPDRRYDNRDATAS